MDMGYLAVIGIAVLSLLGMLLWFREKYKRIIHQYTSTFELIEEGVVLLDSSLRILWLNKISTQCLELSKNKLINKFIDDEALLQEQGLLKKCRDLCLLALRHKQVVSEILTTGIAEGKSLEVIICPTLRGDLIMLLKREGNGKKVGDLSRDFIANASHELRTPITIIKGFAETLDEMTHLTPEMSKEIIRKILRNCERMESLVKNLLLLSDLDNLLECKLHPCEVEDMIDYCVTQIKDLHPEVKIQVEVEGKPAKIVVDKDLVELAILNLLKNAVRYSVSPTEITIRIQFSEKEVRIGIKDRGIGIKKEDLPHIFERFYRVDKARSRKLGGAGLGLSIVKNIIDKHEGTITASSEGHDGSTFEISLPREMIKRGI